MAKRWAEYLTLTLLTAACLGTAFLGGYYARALSVTTPWLRLALPGLPAVDAAEFPLLAEAHGVIEGHYDGELPAARDWEYGAIRGLVAAVEDPYTVFLEPQPARLEADSLSGEYGGIGVGITQNERGEIVLSPYRESPAAEAGLLEGDVLLEVDGEELTATMTLDDVAARVRGPVGSAVALVIRRATGQVLSVTITRQVIALPSTDWRIVDGQPQVGLIAIHRFTDKTPQEVRQAIEELRALGALGLVLDLRNNGGGILDAAIDVAGQFLSGGVVMYETQPNQTERIYTAPAATGWADDAPLAVLVNGGTASAAEIVAGALLDRGRAPLIGQPTFGKGSVQVIVPLSDGSSLHVTARRWFTPSRRDLHTVGLPPTIAVEPASHGGDPELEAAVLYLMGVQ